MGYYTILRETQDEFEERKSIFIGHIKRVNTEEEAKAFVDQKKEKYKDATHNVYAYIIGENAGIQRYSDDGEPKGTGGIPALEVLKKNDLRNVAVVVTRYFGGIMLGAGGLTRAYSKGAAIAVKAGEIVEKVLGSAVIFDMSYDMLGKVQYLCATKEWHIEDTQYTDTVSVILYIENHKIEEVVTAMSEVSSGKIEYLVEDEEFFFKQENRLYREKDV